MLNKRCLQDVLVAYKKDFALTWWENERYKWEAIKTFQDNWKIEANDFADMLDRALSGTKNLLASAHYFPRAMIKELAEEVPEVVRSMFDDLYNEKSDVVERILGFKRKSDELFSKYGAGRENHFQDERAISNYLWLRYPDKYYIYKLRELRAASKILNSGYELRRGQNANNLRCFYSLYDEVCEEIQKDEELKQLLNEHLTNTCYPDPEYRTLTMDVCYFIANRFSSKPRNEWHPLDYSPNISKETWIELLNDPEVFNKDSLTVMACMKDCGGQSTCKHLVEKYGRSVNFYKTQSTAVAMRVEKKVQCFPYKEEGKEFWWPILYTGKDTDEGLFLWKLRDELLEALNVVDLSHISLYQEEENSKKYAKESFLAEVFMDEQKYDKLVAVLRNKKNIILQGAPGVGKTFAARRLAHSMMGEKDDSRIELVQFHQNYSYEDFMMGYKPSENGFEMRKGVFYKFCNKAKSQPDKDFFFIIDEINRGNMNKIFGELLMMIENDYRGRYVTLAYDEIPFDVPKNLYIIGMMNTADRSLAMIDYALRRRFSFIEMTPAFDTKGFTDYQNQLDNDMFNQLIDKVKELNWAITNDNSLGKGFCIGHSYFSNWKNEECTQEKMLSVVEFDIVPMLEEYWFDDNNKVQQWSDELRKVLE